MMYSKVLFTPPFEVHQTWCSHLCSGPSQDGVSLYLVLRPRDRSTRHSMTGFEGSCGQCPHRAGMLEPKRPHACAPTCGRMNGLVVHVQKPVDGRAQPLRVTGRCPQGFPRGLCPWPVHVNVNNLHVLPVVHGCQGKQQVQFSLEAACKLTANTCTANTCTGTARRNAIRDDVPVPPCMNPTACAHMAGACTCVQCGAACRKAAAPRPKHVDAKYRVKAMICHSLHIVIRHEMFA